MAAELLPSIGAAGQWSLKTPFDALLIPNVSYTCKAINKLSEMVASGIDVQSLYYTPNNLDQPAYDQDVKNDVSIITLVSSSGNTLRIPSPYINGWPSSDVVPYVVVGMVVNLGALPNTIDPTFLTDKVSNVIVNALGHPPTIDYVALSEVTNKLYSDHEALENLRQSNITDDNSDYIRRVKAEADLAAAQSTIAALQQFIIDSGVAVPTVPAS